jgi:hypothetical protein
MGAEHVGVAPIAACRDRVSTWRADGSVGRLPSVPFRADAPHGAARELPSVGNGSVLLVEHRALRLLLIAPDARLRELASPSACRRADPHRPPRLVATARICRDGRALRADTTTAGLAARQPDQDGVLPVPPTLTLPTTTTGAPFFVFSHPACILRRSASESVTTWQRKAHG